MARILLKIALVVLLTVGPWYFVRFIGPSLPGVQAKIDSLIEQRMGYMQQNTADPAAPFAGKEWVAGLRQVMRIVVLGAMVVVIGKLVLQYVLRTSSATVRPEAAQAQAAQNRVDAARQDLQRSYQNQYQSQQAVDSHYDNRRSG